MSDNEVYCDRCEEPVREHEAVCQSCFMTMEDHAEQADINADERCREADDAEQAACGWAFDAGVREAERDRARAFYERMFARDIEQRKAIEAALARAEKAERERDEARAEVAKVWREIDCGSDSDECSIDGPLPCRRHAIEELAENRDETIAAIAELDEARARIEAARTAPPAEANQRCQATDPIDSDLVGGQCIHESGHSGRHQSQCGCVWRDR